jgi:hypothetical protein
MAAARPIPVITLPPDMPLRAQRQIASFGHAMQVLLSHAMVWSAREHAEPLVAWVPRVLPASFTEATLGWTDGGDWQWHAPPADWWPLLAWFHLPGLRGLHELALRRARYARLRRVLPRVWRRRAAVLPPGAVLDGASPAQSAAMLTAQPAGYSLNPFSLSGDVRFIRVSWIADADGRVRMDAAAACSAPA